MPELKQAALLAYEYLKNLLASYEYYLIPGTIALWEYKTRLTKFCLCIDDFGIKYWSKEDMDYLCNTIRVNFKYTDDPEEKNYYGLMLDQHYNLGFINIFMPKYILETLKKLSYTPKTIPQYLPYKYIPIQYGNKEQ